MDKIRGAYSPHPIIDILQLDPLQGAAQDRAANVLWEQGRHREAIERWHEALKALARQQDGRVPEAFWGDVAGVLDHVGEHCALPQLHVEADSLLRVYVRRNGEYRVEPLMHAAFTAAANPADGVAWIIDLSRAANDPARFLQSLSSSSWIPEPNREAIHVRVLQILEQRTASARGQERTFAESELNGWRYQWIVYLVDRTT